MVIRTKLSSACHVVGCGCCRLVGQGGASAESVCVTRPAVRGFVFAQRRLSLSRWSRQGDASRETFTLGHPHGLCHGIVRRGAFAQVRRQVIGSACVKLQSHRYFDVSPNFSFEGTSREEPREAPQLKR